ncbi:adenosylcobinamide-GDP ribazoletransferase [Peribacillus sp. SCS-155]|uniref:adenosylcobinamide-GDP ribazoletransferase n=1 Tax=Peribacillus sedimenti TaxID=3115297 RepID=UPI0039067572
MSIWIGLLINIQFFTIIPISKQLPMDSLYVTRAIQTFPLLGLMQGAIYSATLYGLQEWMPFTVLASAFGVWLMTIIITGGLHLDGWMDTSDAFFSYRDINKRLEIMEDPRTGAFAVLSLIVLLNSRFFFIYEIAMHLTGQSLALMAAIPVISRAVMGCMLVKFPLAKGSGLAYFFQSGAQKNSLSIYMLYLLISVFAAGMISLSTLYLFLILLGVSLCALMFLKYKTATWFGGITGDVLGASVEGVELLLWMTLWLFHYFAMG